jgi:hypothetical protein
MIASVGPTADDELRKKIVDTMCAVPLPVARAVIDTNLGAEPGDVVRECRES